MILGVWGVVSSGEDFTSSFVALARTLAKKGTGELHRNLWGLQALHPKAPLSL